MAEATLKPAAQWVYLVEAGPRRFLRRVTKRQHGPWASDRRGQRRPRSSLCRPRNNNRDAAARSGGGAGHLPAQLLHQQAHETRAEAVGRRIRAADAIVLHL